MYRSEELAQIARLAELINPGHAAAKAEQYLKVLLFQHQALQIEVVNSDDRWSEADQERKLAAYASVIVDSQRLLMMLDLLTDIDTAFDRASPSSVKECLKQIKGETVKNRSEAIESLNNLFNQSPDADHL